MKQKLILLLALLLTLTANARTYCIITGVSNYEGTDNDLKASTDDAKRMAKYYRSVGASVRLLTGKHATSTNILSNIEMLSTISKPEDQIVFFFSGHGAENSMLTYDDKDRLYYYALFEALRKVPCTNVVIYIDACFSGTTFSTKGSDGISEYMNYELEQNKGNNEKFIIISSSRNNEKSFEKGARGVFTQYLLSGLSGGADADQNKEITTWELFNYVYKGVGKELKLNDKKQHPNLITNIEKNMYTVLATLKD